VTHFAVEKRMSGDVSGNATAAEAQNARALAMVDERIATGME
jgi:hypothetical protein